MVQSPSWAANWFAASQEIYLFTYLLTPWCKVLLEKLTGLKLVKKFTYLLTYSMVQSPSWEANWFAASQEIYLLTYLLHGAESFLRS